MKFNWITSGTTNPFYARRVFEVKKSVSQAQAKVCGLGQFHFYINGRKVSDHELDPAWTEYDKRIYFVSFDVTELLNIGRNAMGAEVGNGWFIKEDEFYTFSFPAFMPPNPNPYKPFGKSLILGVELTIMYEDGSKEILTTDGAFRTAPHPVTMSNVYGSEVIDGKLAKPGFSEVDFDDSAWEPAKPVSAEDFPKGELKEQYLPPVRVLRTREGCKAGRAFNEETGRMRDIYDFGENMSGILEFKVQGKTGDRIILYPAEKLAANGDVDQVAKNWCVVNTCVSYTVGGDDRPENVRMKFTYFAGRFVGVERIPAEGDDEPMLLSIQADAISSAWEDDGSFECDDDRYMKIYHMIRRTVEANMVGVHTDCPTIERFAWQEPNHLMASSIFYMKNGRRLWEKFLEDMRLSQHTKDDWFLDFAGNRFYPGDGLVPSQCPCYVHNVLPVPGMGSFYDIIPWGSTSILGTYWHYLFYGDKIIIEQNYEMGMRYLEHLKTKVTEDGFICHGLGDWGNPRGELARENIETAFLYADTVVLAGFADVLGKEEDAGKLRAYAEEIKENYNTKLMVQDPETGNWCYRCFDHPDQVFLTQSSQALPLFWGMVPEDRIFGVTESLRHVLMRDGALIAGEVGLPYVIQAARKAGMNELISSYILKEEHPSYYAFILDGETTLGEYWETNPRSHCHDMMGHIIEWYYNGIAGIIPGKPGFSEVVIRPYLPESMHEFICSYKSAVGEIKVHVKETDTDIKVEVRVPEGIPAVTDFTNLEKRGKEVHRV